MLINEHILQVVTEFTNEIVNLERNRDLSRAVTTLSRFLNEDVNGYFNPADELVYGAFTQIQQIYNLVSELEKAENPYLTEHYEALYHHLEDLYCHNEDPLEEYYSNQIEVPDDAFEMPRQELAGA